MIYFNGGKKLKIPTLLDTVMQRKCTASTLTSSMMTTSMMILQVHHLCKIPPPKRTAAVMNCSTLYHRLPYNTHTHSSKLESSIQRILLNEHANGKIDMKVEGRR